MRKTIYLFSLTLLLLSSAASCNSDSSNSSSLSPDCAITSIVMGRLSRIYHTYLPNGKDTSYTTNVAGQSHPLHIDQIERRIFNTDSLPVGTKINKVYFTTFSADGLISYRLDSGKDTLFSLKDTLDMSSPRIFTIYASDGSGRREYTMSINVHNSDPDAYSWHQAAGASTAAASLSDMRLLESGSKLLLWGRRDGRTILLERSLADGDAWKEFPVTGADSLVSGNITTFAGKYYAPSGCALYSSSDGYTWEKTADVPADMRLIGSAGGYLFASAGGKVMKSADATAWSYDTTDDDSALFPSENVASALMPALSNSNIENLVCIGYRDGKTETWKKEFNLAYPEDNAWSYYPATEETPRTLPHLGSFSMMYYDSKLMAAGTSGDTVNVYISEDGARSWQISTLRSIIPQSETKAASLVWTTGEGNTIWLLGSPSGILWKGYLNRLKAAAEE